MVGWRRVIWPLALLVVGCIAGLTAQMNATPQSAQHVDAKFFQDLRWRSIGPARAGRVVAVTGVRANLKLITSDRWAAALGKLMTLAVRGILSLSRNRSQLWAP